MSTPQEQFAIWLEGQHPDIYEALYVTAHNQGVGGLRGLGDDGLTEMSFDPGTVELSDSAVADINAGGALQTFSFESAMPVSTPNIVTDSESGSSGGILSTLSDIGSWLVSPQGLTSLAQVGTAVLKVQQAQDTAKMQMAVINANAQRAAANQSPIPITYQTNEQGQLVPVYDATTAQFIPSTLEQAIAQGRAHQVMLPDGSVGYSVDPPTLSSLLTSNSFSSIPAWVWLVGGGILLAALV